jgi:hypothetical protein
VVGAISRTIAFAAIHVHRQLFINRSFFEQPAGEVGDIPDFL